MNSWNTYLSFAISSTYSDNLSNITGQQSMMACTRPHNTPMPWNIVDLKLLELWFIFDQELLEKCLPKKTRSILLSVSSSNWLVFLRPIMIDYLPAPFVGDIREWIWPFGDVNSLVDLPPLLGICAYWTRKWNFLFTAWRMGNTSFSPRSTGFAAI